MFRSHISVGTKNSQIEEVITREGKLYFSVHAINYQN